MSTVTPLEAPSETFRLLVESVRDYAIFMLDETGHVLTWNRGAERIKGYAASEILGQHFSRFYPTEDVQSGKCERGLEIGHGTSSTSRACATAAGCTSTNTARTFRTSAAKC